MTICKEYDRISYVCGVLESGVTRSFVLLGEKMNTKALLHELEGNINLFLKDRDLIVYDIEWVKEGREQFLRIYIDKPWQEGMDRTYVSTVECQLVSEFVSGMLDDDPQLSMKYTLEVSSPGLERRLNLSRDNHFAPYIGEKIAISLYKALDGYEKIGKKIEVILLENKPDELIVEINEDRLHIPKDNIAKVNAVFEF